MVPFLQSQLELRWPKRILDKLSSFSTSNPGNGSDFNHPQLGCSLFGVPRYLTKTWTMVWRIGDAGPENKLPPLLGWLIELVGCVFKDFKTYRNPLTKLTTLNNMVLEVSGMPYCARFVIIQTCKRGDCPQIEPHSVKQICGSCFHQVCAFFSAPVSVSKGHKASLLGTIVWLKKYKIWFTRVNQMPLQNE